MFLVRSLACLRLPCVLAQNDGTRPVPAGGVLLLRLPGQEPTWFPAEDEAEDAITRTVEHGERYGYGWTVEEFEIQTTESYAAERKRPKMPPHRAQPETVEVEA